MNLDTLSKLKQMIIVFDDESAQIFFNGMNLCEITSMQYHCGYQRLLMAVCSMFSYYYLFDWDYPKTHELAFSVLQYFIFGDQKVPEDIMSGLNQFMGSYTDFKVRRYGK